ncbi:MAG TPA: YdbL family protein [Lacunisphaera sp.]|nr:YdbL family protein [Lacunisphaera sp.]
MNARFARLFAVVCLLAVAAFAASEAELKQRMDQRLTQIDALKAAEAIGENNHGLLEVRPAGKGDAASVVAAENQDREAVYALIAKKAGASAESVARARAKQIAANSRPGVWVQDESGTWKKK